MDLLKFEEIVSKIFTEAVFKFTIDGFMQDVQPYADI